MIGVLTGTEVRLVSGLVSTRILAKPGKKSLIGWSSFNRPSSTSIIAAMPVIGLVIEYTRHSVSGPATGAFGSSPPRPAAGNSVGPSPRPIATTMPGILPSRT